MSGYDWEPHSDQNVSFDTLEPLSVTWGSDEYIQTRSVPVAEYEGPYSAIPLWSDQIFATADHLMSDDFEVSRILELEVPNDAGGLTLTI